MLPAGQRYNEVTFLIFSNVVRPDNSFVISDDPIPNPNVIGARRDRKSQQQGSTSDRSFLHSLPSAIDRNIRLKSCITIC